MTLSEIADELVDYLAGRPSRARLVTRLKRDGYVLTEGQLRELVRLGTMRRRVQPPEPRAPDPDPVVGPNDTPATGDGGESTPAADGEPGGRPRVKSEGDGADIAVTGYQIRTLDELIEAACIDTDTWFVQKWVANTWAENWQVKAWLQRRLAADVAPARATIAFPRVLKRAASTSGRTALIVPDSQNGYSREPKSGHLTPMHDRLAWDLAVQSAALLQPDDIILLGDMVDLAAWGSYRVEPRHRFTTQPTLDELHWWIAALRQAAPGARIRYFAGNHEDRIDRALTDRVDEAVDVRPVGSTEAALSIGSLLRLDLLGVEYVAPYGEVHWLWDAVRLEHGQAHGRTALESTLAKSTAPSIIGHTHHREVIWRTIESVGGPREIFALSPGCICHVDGRVPGARRGQQNWQQGLAVLREIDGEILPELAPIVRGRASIAGRTLIGVDRTAEIATATGWLM